MDLCNMFKSNLKKGSNHFGANTNVKAVRQRLGDHRRETRNNLMIERRQIPQIMSPITPAPSVHQVEENLKPVNKRLEMLAKWKLEKEKRKLQEKQNSKPIFKVCHIDNKLGLPNLETINKEIKGKPIKHKSKFAPDNHKFKAPENIKAINFVQNRNKQTDKVAPQTHRMVTRSQKVKETTFKKLEDKSMNTQKTTRKNNNVKKEALEAPRKMRHTDQRTSSSKLEPNKKLPIVTKKNAEKTIKKSKTPIAKTSENPDTENSETVENLNEKTTIEDTPSKITRMNSSRRTSTPLQLSFRKPKKTPMPSKSGKKNKLVQNESSNTSLSTEETKKLNKSLNNSSSIYSPASVSFKSMSTDYPPNDSSNNSILSEIKTPKNSAKSTSHSASFTAYISPFVTVSRGKDSARKEYHSRKSKGGYTPELPNTSPKVGALYFRNLLVNESQRIKQTCEEWLQYKECENLPEEVSALIDVAIGQSNLLMTKKFQQFSNLIDSCDDNYNENQLHKVTCEDLHGFWDTMYIQINNIDKRFDNLHKMKENNWEEVLPVINIQKKVAGKKSKKNNQVKASSSIRDAIKMAKLKKQQIENQAPIRTPTLRKSLLSNVQSNGKRRNSSPGLIMMKVAMLTKDVTTPGKSILKTTETCKSSRKKNVFFKDNSNNDEENDLNLNNYSFTKTDDVQPKRRSSRIRQNCTKLF